MSLWNFRPVSARHEKTRTQPKKNLRNPGSKKLHQIIEKRFLRKENLLLLLTADEQITRGLLARMAWMAGPVSLFAGKQYCYCIIKPH